MSAKSPEQLLKDASAWWSTALIDIRPGEIGIGGYPIQDLIGKLSFPEMIWVMLRSELPTAERAKLLEAAMVAAVDHGPQAPSIAISRMAITCGLPINGDIARAAIGDLLDPRSWRLLADSLSLARHGDGRLLEFGDLDTGLSADATFDEAGVSDRS